MSFLNKLLNKNKLELIKMDYWEAQKDFNVGEDVVTVTIKGKTKKIVNAFLKKYKLEDK